MRSLLRKSPTAPLLLAFSLIEFVGVLSVIAIMAATLVPAVFRSLDRAAWTKEANDMSAISNALSLQVLRNYAIPNEANWMATVANWSARPASQISTNNRGFARLFFYDQGGWQSAINGNLPFTQGQGGTAPGIPSSARIAIVSTVAKALPYTNGALSTANFNSIWSAAQGTIPSYFTSLGWGGRGDDLVIQRIPVDPLFHHLILTKRDTSGTAAYSINSTAVSSAVPNGPGGINSYYLDGTSVGLASADFTNWFVLTRDVSLTFEAGEWRDRLTGDGTDNSLTAQNFTIQAQTFIQTASILGLHQGADTQGALSALYAFMYAYTIWANKCPHFQFTGNNGTSAVDYQILNDLAQNGSGGIINGATGSGGLLK